jgi:hypothetical protein
MRRFFQRMLFFDRIGRKADLLLTFAAQDCLLTVQSWNGVPARRKP